MTMKRARNEMDTDPQAKKPRAEPSRAVHIGNLHPNTSYYDVCSVANKHGAIELVKILPKKAHGFLNFVTQESAENFVAECTTKPFVTFGKTARIGWAKAAEMKEELKQAIENDGATRNLFVGNINNRPPSVVNEDMLSQIFTKFGEIENIVLKSDKAIAFVNMTSITAARKAVLRSEQEPIECAGRKLKIQYAPEGKRSRDPRLLVRVEQPPLIPHGYPPVHGHTPPPVGGHPHGPPSRIIQGKIDGPGSRAVFLGNLPLETTYKDIFKIANNYGAVDWCKLNVDKKNAFINFVQNDGAGAMVRAAQTKAFIVHGNDITANYAKATPILPEVQQFLMEGATRNLFIAGIGDITTEDEIKALLNPYCRGEFDSISILQAKKIAFVNLTSVKVAASAKAAIGQQIVNGKAPVLGGVAISKVKYAKEHTRNVGRNLGSHPPQQWFDATGNGAYGKSPVTAQRNTTVNNDQPDQPQPDYYHDYYPQAGHSESKPRFPTNPANTGTAYDPSSYADYDRSTSSSTYLPGSSSASPYHPNPAAAYTAADSYGAPYY